MDHTWIPQGSHRLASRSGAERVAWQVVPNEQGDRWQAQVALWSDAAGFQTLFGVYLSSV